MLVDSLVVSEVSRPQFKGKIAPTVMMVTAMMVMMIVIAHQMTLSLMAKLIGRQQHWKWRQVKTTLITKQ
jgi:hypothetical protein